MPLINILHLTDIHFTQKKSHDQKVVFDALIKSLEADAGSYLKPDLIVLSGDIVNDADEEDVYGYLVDKLLTRILKASNIGDSRVIVSAGNHDIPRSFVSSDKARHIGLRQTLTDRDALNADFLSGHLDDLIAHKFKNFRIIDDLVGPSAIYRNALVALYDFPDLGISIVEANSAWMGTAGIEGYPKDLRELLIPEAGLAQALENIPENRYVVFVSHHPFNWLAEFSEQDVRRTLGANAQMHLFGHMHDPAPSLATNLQGTMFSQQGGAIFTHRNYYQGYSIIRVDTTNRHIELNLRSYFESRREFDVAIDKIKNGIFYPNQNSHNHYTSMPKNINHKDLGKWCANVLNKSYKLQFSEGISEKSVTEIFVAPPLYKENEISNGLDDTPTITEVSVTFDSIKSSESNFVIYGKAEYGKTTLLQQLALNILQDAIQAGNNAIIPAVIKFSEIKRGTDRIETLIRSSIPELPDGNNIKEVLAAGCACLIIDDVDLRDQGRYDELKAFISKYPRNRFIFSTSRNADGQFKSIVEMQTAVNFEHVFIRPMRRKDMRSLIEKWDPEHKLDQESMLNRVLDDIRKINIPVTAVNGTILLSILENHFDFSPINRTVLIERFIEVLLEKRAESEIQRRSFDFRNRTHFLAALSKYMTENNEYVMSEAKILLFTEEYLSGIGIVYNASALISNLLTARILAKRQDSQIAFRYRAFLEYFIARRMYEDRNFKSWILEEARYFSFLNEIHYYAGIGRDDLELLEMIGARFKKLDQVLFKDGTAVDLASFETLSLPAKTDSSDKILQSIEDQIRGPRLTDAERDEILEGELPRDVEGRQEVFRPVPKDDGARWFVGLTMYSNVLRNLELIPDAAKRGHLSDLLEAWGRFMILSILSVPSLAKHKQVIVNGLRYNVQVPAHFSFAQTARFLFLEVPNAVSKLAFGALGTPKLQEQISRLTAVEENEHSVIRLLRVMLGINLQLPSWLDDSRTFLRASTGLRYISEVLVWKLGDAHTLQRLDKQTAERLGEIIATGIANTKGGTPVERAKIRDEKIKVFRQKDLVRRLRIEEE